MQRVHRKGSFLPVVGTGGLEKRWIRGQESAAALKMMAWTKMAWMIRRKGAPLHLPPHHCYEGEVESIQSRKQMKRNVEWANRRDL